MKTTTTLYEILQSELIRAGNSEFINKEQNQLVFFQDDFAFIKKAMSYDNDIKKIVNRMFFQGYTLENDKSDDDFKATFLNRFFNREIGFQTIEAFSSQVVYNFLAKYRYLNKLYDELDDYIDGKTNSKDITTDNELNDTRYLSSDLPQNEINLNVEDTVLDYGNQNSLTRSRKENEGTATHESTALSLDELLKTQFLFEEIFIDFDRKCFLQVW